MGAEGAIEIALGRFIFSHWHQAGLLAVNSPRSSDRGHALLNRQDISRKQQRVTLRLLTLLSLLFCKPPISAAKRYIPAPFDRLRQRDNKGGPGLPLAAPACLRPRFASGFYNYVTEPSTIHRLLALLAG